MGSTTATNSAARVKVGKGTLQELFAFNDWARDKIMACASPLEDDMLDRGFEMGEGSIRKTMNHLYSAERVWLDRWMGNTPQYRVSAEGVTMAGLWEEFRALAACRNEYVARFPDADLDKPLTYTNMRGQVYTFAIGAMMLHVCNHGSHHRAQAINMLRRVGVSLPKPEADYIFMKIESPEGTPCKLDVDTIRSYFAFTDFSRERVHSAAAALSDEQLDRPFEMGLGTLRKTLVHIQNAEQWWLTNWTKGPGEPFPPADDKAAVVTISTLSAETAAGRNEVLRTITDEGLRRVVSVVPRPGVTRSFPIGVTMLQICHHGTHHRAQAVNMLRHLGGAVPGMDLLEMLKRG